VLAAAEEDVEVIAVCDGYSPDPPIKGDRRVTVIQHQESIGQRQSINEAARLARGKYILKLDAHCNIAKGFDVVLKHDCRYEWTMIPRMYTLDIVTFEPKLNKKTDYMYISAPDHKDGDRPYGFRAMYYGRYAGANGTKPSSDKLIDETMCCMGPGWFLHKDRIWELGGCDEGHGSWGQMGVEVALKAWLSGGALMVNKRTWFAHWFRGGGVPEGFKSGFPYSIKQGSIDRARAYSKDLWTNNRWPQQTRNLEWLVQKFNPPTWNLNGDGMTQEQDEYATEEGRMGMYIPMYKNIHRRKHDAYWKGVAALKFPSDLQLYHEAIWEKRPDYIVEIGTKFGGSALFFQDMLDMCGPGQKVITIDIKDNVRSKDNRIEYVSGNSADKAVVAKVKGMIAGDTKKTMVVIDGNHNRTAVKWDLHNYAPMVTKGQYLVVEDCYIDRGLYGPGEARDWFLSKHSNFKKTNVCRKYLVGLTMGGWLVRA